MRKNERKVKTEDVIMTQEVVKMSKAEMSRAL